MLGFLLPTILEQLLIEGPIKIFSFTVAAWFRYLAVVDDQGQEMPFQDLMASLLRDRALRGGPDPRVLMSIGTLFCEVLPNFPPFVE